MSLVRVGLPLTSNKLPTLFAPFIALALLVGVGIPTAQAQVDIRVSTNNLPIVEGTFGQYTISLIGTGSAEVTVRLRPGGSTDFGIIPATFTLSNPGRFSRTVNIRTFHDADSVNDMGVFAHTSPAWTGERGLVTVTILDDENSPDFGTSNVPNQVYTWHRHRCTDIAASGQR